jgi:type 1 fimbria pilin
VINLAGAQGGQNVASTQILVGTATMPYGVSYFATGRAGAGIVNSVVNYTIEYP